MSTTVEMRCPLDAQRMFGRLVMEEHPVIVDGNLMEFSCDKCRRKAGGRRVLHYFNIAGEHVKTRTL